MPTIHIEDAYFLDKTFKMSPEMANSLAQNIFRNKNEIVIPITRPVLTETELGRGNSVYMNKVLQGTIPHRMAFCFVNNRAWRAESSTQNPYVYQYLGIKKFKLHFGNKTWPNKDGYEFMDIPAKAPPYSPAELDQIILRNWTVFRDNMKVFAGERKDKDLVLNARDWFTHSFILCVDMTPLASSAEMEHVAFPRLEGFLDVEIEFVHELRDVYTMVMLSEYTNQYNITVPTFQVMRDW